MVVEIERFVQNCVHMGTQFDRSYILF